MRRPGIGRIPHANGQVHDGRRLEQTLGDVDELVGQLRELTGVRR
jgi:hypothetical protein